MTRVIKHTKHLLQFWQKKYHVLRFKNELRENDSLNSDELY